MGATNVDVQINIHDNLTGANWSLHNPQGQVFVTDIDTQEMPCAEGQMPSRAEVYAVEIPLVVHP